MDGEIVEYKWDFGDGIVTSQQNPVHFYAKAGIYNVTLTVTDDDGDIATITRQIMVISPDSSPPITTKSIGIPRYTNRSWITSSTPMWLNATDNCQWIGSKSYTL